MRIAPHFSKMQKKQGRPFGRPCYTSWINNRSMNVVDQHMARVGACGIAGDGVDGVGTALTTERGSAPLEVGGQVRPRRRGAVQHGLRGRGQRAPRRHHLLAPQREEVRGGQLRAGRARGRLARVGSGGGAAARGHLAQRCAPRPGGRPQRRRPVPRPWRCRHVRTRETLRRARARPRR